MMLESRPDRVKKAKPAFFAHGSRQANGVKLAKCSVCHRKDQ